MQITAAVIIALCVALATLLGAWVAAQRKFRADILKLAVEASAKDFDSFEKLDDCHMLPMSASLSFYVEYFTALQEGAGIEEAMQRGVGGMTSSVDHMRRTDITFYQQHPGLRGFHTVDSLTEKSVSSK